MPSRGTDSSPLAAAITVNDRTRDGHLQERERAGVVAGREPLHRDDLERLRDAFPSTSAFPSAEPPGTPFSSSSPATARATPAQAAAATGVRNRSSAINGVSTT